MQNNSHYYELMLCQLPKSGKAPPCLNCYLNECWNMGDDQETVYRRREFLTYSGNPRGTLSCLETTTIAEVTQLLLRTPCQILAIPGKQDIQYVFLFCVAAQYCTSLSRSWASASFKLNNSALQSERDFYFWFQWITTYVIVFLSKLYTSNPKWLISVT